MVWWIVMRRQMKMVDDARWTGLDVENGELGGLGVAFSVKPR